MDAIIKVLNGKRLNFITTRTGTSCCNVYVYIPQQKELHSLLSLTHHGSFLLSSQVLVPLVPLVGPCQVHPLHHCPENAST